MALSRKSSGKKRLREGYLGRNFHVNNKTYVVEEVIAEGGFAVVLEVRGTATNERLALKRIAVNDEHDLYLCRQEIAIMKALSDCLHSVTYIDSQINRLTKEVYEVLILMQLYAGQPVIQLLQRRLSSGNHLSQNEALKIFTDVCQAVARLHHRTKPITHRDLKVENILQDFSGNFVLCDYGSSTTQIMKPDPARVSESEEQIQKYTTLAYRAPEMIDLYSGHEIGPKSDIWALGCTLYKLCFFDTPFGEQRLAILRGDLNFPSSSPYSSELHSLIRYILNPDPSERPDIYQVCNVSFRLLGKPNPVANVFKSSSAVLPSLEEPGPAAKTTPVAAPSTVSGVGRTDKLTVSSIPTVSSSPFLSARHAPVITTTSISSRERPRARPSSTNNFSPAPSPVQPRSVQQEASSPNLSVRSVGGSGIGRSVSVPLTESADRLHCQQPATSHSGHCHHSNLDQFGSTPFSVPPNPSPASTISQPLPPAVDMFGHAPFSGNDTFGAKPFSSTRVQ